MKGFQVLSKTLNLCFIVLLVGVFPAFTSCKKSEEPPKQSTSAVPLNPYTTDSIYNQVKEKLKKNPNDISALYHLADLYDRNSQYVEAIETYRKVLKLKPDMGYAYFKIGTAYSRLDKPEESVKAFKDAKRLMPDYPVLYNNMGVAYGKMNKYREEIRELKKAIELRPHYSTARFNLGVTYMKTGRKKDAMKQYTELKKFDEGIADALLNRIQGNAGS
ncbi:MAG: tetratricopeptide repeat protein [Candidatus Sulfobium sp.]|jgi:tetratricopeptide (TPR) repeat protein